MPWVLLPFHLSATGRIGYPLRAMGSGAARLAITTVDDERHLRLSGDLDSYSAPDLDAALDALGPEGDVVIDLAGLSFMDSSGLRVLIGAHTALDGKGNKLVLTSPSRAVSRLFEISGLTEHFHLA